MSAPYQIEFNNQQSLLPIEVEPLREAIATVLGGEGVTKAEISVAILDDPAIHVLNRKHLEHDYPTDILSFVFDFEDGVLDGELIASAEYAKRSADEIGWPAFHELSLYLVHGTLHLVGYDDRAEDDRTQMRELERRYLSQVGIELPSNGFTRTPMGGASP